jgi:hypothetical protein
MVGPAVAQLLHRPGRHEPPVLDDRHRLAQALDELELVRGEHDWHAGGRVVGQHPAQDVDADGVEPGERLVEHQQLRIVNERRRQLHALLVAERQRLDAIAGAVRQPQPLDPRVGRAAGRGRVHAVQPREVDELVTHPHLRIQPTLLRHISKTRAPVEGHRTTGEQHLAAIGGEHAQDDAHRRRLAGAVRADEAEHLARADGERHTVQRHDIAVAAREVPQLEHL